MATETGENKYVKYGQPSLDLVFTGLKESVTDRVGNVGLEFTRSSTATYVGSDGLVKSAAVNEARFDHDKDGNGLGLLIEESRTNELTYSEDFTQSPWTTVNTTVTANSGTAPDGTNTATFLAETNVSNYFGIYYNSSPSFTDCTTTVYVKANGRNYCNFYLNVQNRNFAGAMFDLVNLTFTLTEGSESTFTSHSASIEEMPNGWRKLRLTVDGPSITRPNFILNISSDGSSPNTGQDGRTPAYQGDSTKGLLIWGTQSEFASFPTSYIPTTSSTVTRAVDTVSLTGTNFSNWYNGSEGSIFIDMKRPVGDSNLGGAFLDFHNDAGLFLQDASGNFIARIGKETAFITLGDPDTTTDYKIASSYQSANDFKVSSNGSSVTSASTAVDFTTATELHIGRGNNSTTAHYRNGPRTLHLKRFTFRPTRLSDSDLQRLTE